LRQDDPIILFAGSDFDVFSQKGFERQLLPHTVIYGVITF
jgi:hypothetical protein